MAMTTSIVFSLCGAELVYFLVGVLGLTFGLAWGSGWLGELGSFGLGHLGMGFLMVILMKHRQKLPEAETLSVAVNAFDRFLWNNFYVVPAHLVGLFAGLLSFKLSGRPRSQVLLYLLLFFALFNLAVGPRNF